MTVGGTTGTTGTAVDSVVVVVSVVCAAAIPVINTRAVAAASMVLVMFLLQPIVASVVLTNLTAMKRQGRR
jgi:hypothetical protein